MKPAITCMPAADLTDRLFDRYAEVRPHHPAPRCTADLLAGREPVFRKRFSPLLPVAKDARILDLGCGYGEFLYFLQQAGYTSACGIDLDRAQLEVARGLGIRNVHRADAREFLRSARSFDFISALDVLEHIPKYQVIELLERVRRALEPRGRFLCQVPNLAAFHTPLFFMDFTHQTPFTASSLKQALELAGFARVRLFAMGPVAHGLRSATRCAVWKIIAAALRATQTIEGGPRDGLCSIFTSAIAATAEPA
ncbi:MAG TPA: class I SAM-dependent methyltransferase [Terriglobia bacterium]|nr:class I SAM-dependent methyltransferase [Terriglobia bacterium]